MGRDLVFALSLANLCMISVYGNLKIIISMNNQYHSQLPINMNFYFAAILNNLLLAAFFLIVITLIRRSKNPLFMKINKVVFFLIFTLTLIMIPFNYMHDEKSNISKTLLFVFVIVFIILSLRMYARYRKQIISLPVNVVLILFPFFLFNIFLPALVFIKLDPSEFTDKPPAEAFTVKDKTNPRIVWIIYDEMDQRLTSEDRPVNLALPEIDRFRAQAICANNAYPPGGETDISLPSLITGKMISKVEFKKANELLIKVSNEDNYVSWGTVSNIFSEVSEMGINTALIGWYLPYGRILGNSLTSTSWRAYEYHRQASFSEAMAQQVELTIKLIPVSRYFNFLSNFYVNDELKQKDRIQSYLDILGDSKTAVANHDLGLILVHIPVPHPPGFYNSTKNDFTIKGGGYLDNLILSDQCLGELRQEMERSDTWENTTVLITSDHWLRMDYWGNRILGIDNNNSIVNEGTNYKVPYMLKLAGQKEGVVYEQAFNTVLTHDLILAIMKNEISSPDDVAEWIDDKQSAWSIPDYSSMKRIN